MIRLLRPAFFGAEGLAEGVADFPADDTDVSRGGKTDPHPAAPRVQHDQGDVAADLQPFPGLSAENKHDLPPP
jgi:hypothetical protein